MPKPSLFHCPVDGCTATFSKHGNLYRHLEIGKHYYTPLRQSFRDYVTKTYADTLEEKVLTSKSDSLTAALNELSVDVVSEDDTLPLGWALRQRAASTRFSPDVHEYLKDLFNEGVLSGRKVDPEVAAKRMRNELRDIFGDERRFKTSELLTWRQIASIFSAFAREQRQKSSEWKERFAKPADVREVFNADEDNDFRSEPIFPTEEDEVVETLHEQYEEIFETER